MQSEEEIINKVAESGLMQIDLEDYLPKGEKVILDLKDFLFEGILLREKDFRSLVKNYNWGQYEGKYIALTCSSEAILPTWAFMLITSALLPYAKKIVNGGLEKLTEVLLEEGIANMNIESFRNQKVMVKGCGHIDVPPSAYIAVTTRLKPVVQSLMYGEACSTVPVWKK